MTHGYEYFDFDYVDMDNAEFEFWMEDAELYQENIDSDISSLWDEIENIYDVYQS